MAEQRLAAWDDSADAALFASGMAAISTALLAWSDADRPVCTSAPVRRHATFLGRRASFHGAGGECLDHLDSLENALVEAGGARPGIVYLETPANPTMQIQRIRTASEWAAKHSTEDHRILVMVDNTYLGRVAAAGGARRRPVLYSATKYIGGHSDLIAGAASGHQDVMAKVKEFRTFLGGMADPWTSWMLARSMETLHVRVERQQASTGHSSATCASCAATTP